MAKEVVTPDPIPVRSGDNIDIDPDYCLTYMNSCESSYSDVTKDIINYLKTANDNINYGASNKSFMINSSTTEKVINNIVNAGIKGVNKNTINKHVIAMQTGNDVLLSVNVY